MIIKEIRFGNIDTLLYRLVYDKTDKKRGNLYKLQTKKLFGWKDVKKDGKKVWFHLYPKTVEYLIKKYMKD